MSPAPERPRRRGRALLLGLLVAAGVTEVTAFREGLRSHELFRATGERGSPAAEDSSFDPELGWNSVPTIRIGPADGPVLGQSFGDSFTYCSEVPAGDTWQEQFATLTGKRILNLGVGAHGLDQAVLKFEREGRQAPPPLTLLGLYGEEYKRCLSYRASDYFRESPDFRHRFKPIFIPVGTGFELRPPPPGGLATWRDLAVRPSADLVDFMQEWDHWWSREQARPEHRFPFSLALFATRSERLEERERDDGLRDRFFWAAHARPLALHLIDRFVAGCARAGTEPVCLILHSPHDLGWIRRHRKRWDQPVLDHLARRGIRHLDLAAVFLEEGETGDLAAFRAPGGHFNAAGNRRIAGALATFLVPAPR